MLVRAKFAVSSQATAGRASRRRLITGSPPRAASRRSKAVKPANATRLAARQAQVQAGQPCSRPNASGVTSSAIAAVSRPTPGRSSRASPRLSRGSSTAAPASATTPTGTLTQKIDRQPVPNASAAMSGPPSAWPMTALPDMVITRTLSARARARRSAAQC